MTKLRRLALLAIPIALAACGDSVTDPGRADPVDLALPWTTATPESQGIDSGRLRDAVNHAATLPRILSLLVVRHGRLVAEEYFNGNGPDSLNDVRSITKSIVSSLVGIAVSQNIVSVDQTVHEYLDSFYDELPPDLDRITIRNLLTMSGGFQWDETTPLGYNEWLLSGNYIGYLLARPVVDTPGTTFRYNSAAVHLLSVLLQLATNVWMDDFADQYLFAPIGIDRSRWETLPDGWPNGASGIDLRPRDLARIGTLWLQRGRSGQNQILPESWVAGGTEPAFAWWDGSPLLRDQSYGYLWWLTRATQPGPAFIASGHGGQYIYVLPGKDMVVVVTHDWRGAGEESGTLSTNGLDLIVNHVLPAAR